MSVHLLVLFHRVTMVGLFFRFVTLDKVTAEYSAAIGAALPKIARAILAATGASHFNVLQNNGRPAHQEIGHVHFHIIPKPDNGGGLGFRGSFWKSKPIDKAAASELAAKISALIKAEDNTTTTEAAPTTTESDSAKSSTTEASTTDPENTDTSTSS